MLGVCLLFVGIVMINNGMCSLYNVALVNIFWTQNYKNYSVTA